MEWGKLVGLFGSKYKKIVISSLDMAIWRTGFLWRKRTVDRYTTYKGAFPSHHRISRAVLDHQHMDSNRQRFVQLAIQLCSPEKLSFTLCEDTPGDPMWFKIRFWQRRIYTGYFGTYESARCKHLLFAKIADQLGLAGSTRTTSAFKFGLKNLHECASKMTKVMSWSIKIRRKMRLSRYILLD